MEEKYRNELNAHVKLSSLYKVRIWFHFYFRVPTGPEKVLRNLEIIVLYLKLNNCAVWNFAVSHFWSQTCFFFHPYILFSSNTVNEERQNHSLALQHRLQTTWQEATVLILGKSTFNMSWIEQVSCQLLMLSSSEWYPARCLCLSTICTDFVCKWFSIFFFF